MKTILTSYVFLLASSFAAFAAPSYWAAINTAEYSGDKTPSTANVADYQAYYCTAEAAQKMFGASTVSGIEDYLSENFATGKAAMGSTKGSVAIGESGYYEDGQYTFIERFAAAVASDSYIGVAFYGSAAFRVFGSDNAVLDSGKLTFDDQASGTVGSWQQVPEPTSGLLLLLGVAGLALRRKRA